MKIKLLPEKTLATLKASVEANLPLYRADEPFEFDDVIDTGLSVQTPTLQMGGFETDCANVIALHEALCGLPFSIIRDERFWAYLTHVEFKDYTLSRWNLPGDDEKAVKAVNAHFFAGSERLIESRNALSRLYWAGHVVSRYPGDFGKTVEMLASKQAILFDVIERPGVILIPAVFNALAARLTESYETDGVLLTRPVFRELQKELNVACGSMFIEGMSQERAQQIVDSVIDKVVPVSDLAPAFAA